MLIGVLADTHDRLPAIDAAMELFARSQVEAVIHAGDFVAPFAMKRVTAFAGPLYATFGNNDGEREGLRKVFPELQDGPVHVELGGRAVLVHHFIDWCAPADVARAEIIITGHTHETMNEHRDGKLFLNPGECCGWVNGTCTVALLETDGPSARICELPC